MDTLILSVFEGWRKMNVIAEIVDAKMHQRATLFDTDRTASIRCIALRFSKTSFLANGKQSPTPEDDEARSTWQNLSGHNGLLYSARTSAAHGRHQCACNFEKFMPFRPCQCSVALLAAMAFKIADAGESELFEIIRLVQRVMEIGIATDRVEGSVFVDFCSLGCNGPRHFAVESRGDLSAVDARELEERLERLRVRFA